MMTFALFALPHLWWAHGSHEYQGSTALDPYLLYVGTGCFKEFKISREVSTYGGQKVTDTSYVAANNGGKFCLAEPAKREEQPEGAALDNGKLRSVLRPQDADEQDCKDERRDMWAFWRQKHTPGVNLKRTQADLSKGCRGCSDADYFTLRKMGFGARGEEKFVSRGRNLFRPDVPRPGLRDRNWVWCKETKNPKEHEFKPTQNADEINA